MNKQEIIQQLKRLVALVEDIDSTLFHHNHDIDGYHLNGDMEPIMNFVADFDMEALTGAKEAIQSLTTPTSESKVTADILVEIELQSSKKAKAQNYPKDDTTNFYKVVFEQGARWAMQTYATQSNAEAMREHAIGLDNILQLIKSDSVYALLRRGFKSPSSSGVDHCEDNDYIDLYNLSVILRANKITNT